MYLYYKTSLQRYSAYNMVFYISRNLYYKNQYKILNSIMTINGVNDNKNKISCFSCSPIEGLKWAIKQIAIFSGLVLKIYKNPDAGQKYLKVFLDTTTMEISNNTPTIKNIKYI